MFYGQPKNFFQDFKGNMAKGKELTESKTQEIRNLFEETDYEANSNWLNSKQVKEATTIVYRTIGHIRTNNSFRNLTAYERPRKTFLKYF